MNEKVFLFSGLVVLIGFAIFASATMGTLEYPGTVTDTEIREVTLNVEKGWNLLQGFANPDWLVSGLSPSNIKAIYAFNPQSQEYVRFYPQPEIEKISEGDFRWNSYIASNAFWVYSDESGRATYKTKEATPLESVNLFKGWNFVGFSTNVFYSDTFSWNKVKGSCILEKISGWNYEEKEWIIISPNLEDPELNDFLDMAMVVKVTNDCKLEKPSEEVQNVPSLPN
jgi:hypothetical protein